MLNMLLSLIVTYFIQNNNAKLTFESGHLMLRNVHERNCKTRFTDYTDGVLDFNNWNIDLFVVQPTYENFDFTCEGGATHFFGYQHTCTDVIFTNIGSSMWKSCGAGIHKSSDFFFQNLHSSADFHPPNATDSVNTESVWKVRLMGMGKGLFRAKAIKGPHFFPRFHGSSTTPPPSSRLPDCINKTSTENTFLASSGSGHVKFYSGEEVPLEMHKVRMVQRVTLLPVEARREAMRGAGFNTFLLKNRDIFLDMLSDSGVNAMSENQYAAMMQADDSYAGSETFFRLEAVVQQMFGMQYFLPAHQGRACENILARTFVKPGKVVLMNYHFTTAKALITDAGGVVEELVDRAGLEVVSDLPFKGNVDLGRLREAIERYRKDGSIAFFRMEAGTNLIGGQPISVENIRAVSEICRAAGILFVFDASLLADNLYFIKTREAGYRDVAVADIVKEISALCDIIYFSARKLGCARGGGIVTNSTVLYLRMRELVPLYEGFLTYGGMSVREMEAIAVGLKETLDMHVIEQTPIFVKALVDELVKKGVPVVLPAGGLGAHLDAARFCDHLNQTEYPAAALGAAVFIAGGVRGMERGTMSEQRGADGSERLAEMELLRLAVPKRVFTLSQIKYVADRVGWLYENRRLIGGLQFVEEPRVLRFFFGKMDEKTPWTDKLVKKFRADFGEDSL